MSAACDAAAVGEFRTRRSGFKLAGAKALRSGSANSTSDPAANSAEADELAEDDFQFLLHILCEHLSEDQLSAVLSSVDYGERGTVGYAELSRVLRFVNPSRHRPDVKGLGSLAQNTELARELQARAACMYSD